MTTEDRYDAEKSRLAEMSRDEIFAKWLDILRDRGSEKNTGCLEDPDCHYARCCLGHLCHALEVPMEVTERIPESVFYGLTDGLLYDHSAEVLPDYVAEAVGIRRNGRFRRPIDEWPGAQELLPFMDEYYLSDSGDRVDDLTMLNDSTGASLDQIANVIEYAWKHNEFEPYDEKEK